MVDEKARWHSANGGLETSSKQEIELVKYEKIKLHVAPDCDPGATIK